VCVCVCVCVFNRVYGQCFEFFLSFFNPSRKLVYKPSQGVTVEKYPPLKFFRFHIFSVLTSYVFSELFCAL